MPPKESIDIANTICYSIEIKAHKIFLNTKWGDKMVATPWGNLDIIGNEDKVQNKNRIAILEKLLAIEIGRASELLKANAKLEIKLGEVRRQRDCWRKLYRKIKPNEKVPCDRSKAMIEFGDIDMSEVVGSK